MKCFTLLACTMASLLLTAACKGDLPIPQATTSTSTSTSQPTTPNPGQQLVDKTWVLTGVTVDPGLQTNTGTTVTDIYQFIPACTKDDTQQFLTGGVFKSDEGATKCDPADPQTVTGSWTMTKSGNDTALSMTVSGGTLHLKVLSISDTQLQVSTQDDVFGIGTTTNTYTLTYAKK